MDDAIFSNSLARSQGQIEYYKKISPFPNASTGTKAFMNVNYSDVFGIREGFNYSEFKKDQDYLTMMLNKRVI